MPVFTQSPDLDNALVNPANWGDEGWVHDQFSWLRANEPLKQICPEGFEPFWNVTRYADIKTIEGNRRVFINDPRPTLGQKMMTEMLQQIKEDIEKDIKEADEEEAESKADHDAFISGNIRLCFTRLSFSTFLFEITLLK